MQRVRTYEITGDQLILYTVLGEKVLTYKKGQVQAIATTPKSTSPASMRTLTGNWALKSYSDGKGAFIPTMTNARSLQNSWQMGHFPDLQGVTNTQLPTRLVVQASVSARLEPLQEPVNHSYGTGDLIPCPPSAGREIHNLRR